MKIVAEKLESIAKAETDDIKKDLFGQAAFFILRLLNRFSLAIIYIRFYIRFRVRLYDTALDYIRQESYRISVIWRIVRQY